MSDPFDYGDSKDLKFELDLPADLPPPRHAPGRGPSTPPPAPGLSTAPPPAWAPTAPPAAGPSTAPPTPAAAPTAPADTFSLELEDIAPPAATPSLHSMGGTRPAPLALPQPAAPPQQPPAVRTLEVRVAESVDRMSSFARGGLVALTIVGMFMLGVSVLSMGVRSATRSMEELQRVEAAEAAQDAADAARYEQGGYDDDEDRD